MKYILKHAPVGGEVGRDGKFRPGGEFEPFYVPRPLMPQIDDADYVELLAFADSKGVTWRFQTFDPRKLHAHQRISMKRVMAMPERVLKIPGLVSLDLFILDGNHRWEGHVMNHTDFPAYQFDLCFDAALKFLLSFPKVKPAEWNGEKKVA
jgi:hypothetical protein